MGATVNAAKAMAKPKFRSAVPTFLVPDVAATARWYEANLGFAVTTLPENEPCFFASLQREGAELILLSRENYQKEQISRTGGNWDAYIRMDGVREFYEEVRQKIPIRMELVKQSYGNWEFEVFDPNGYVLVFGGDEERS